MKDIPKKIDFKTADPLRLQLLNVLIEKISACKKVKELLESNSLSGFRSIEKNNQYINSNLIIFRILSYSLYESYFPRCEFFGY